MSKIDIINHCGECSKHRHPGTGDDMHCAITGGLVFSDGIPDECPLENASQPSDSVDGEKLCGFCGQEEGVSHTGCLQIVSTRH